MKNTDINNGFMLDEGKTFAEWKEWVRKFKPTQAKAHVVQATLKNGKKFDRVYGSYVDAQNNAFALKQQLGAKNVKMFTSVNGGPLKLERSFDSADQFDADEKFFFEVLAKNGRLISRIKAPETISQAIAYRLADQESAKFKKPWAKCRIVNSKGHSFETYNRNFKVNEFVAKNMDSAENHPLLSRIADKYAIDAVFPTSKGFANEKGLLKRDTRKGLKPYEVTFVVKGKDGRPFNTKRSKMAASLEEAKKWAQAESKKYNGVTKIDVKEFKDSADDFANDTLDRVKAKYCLDAVGYSYADLKTALSMGDIKPNQRMVSSVGGGMAKTSKEWLDMGMKVVNANKPYPLDKMKKR